MVCCNMFLMSIVQPLVSWCFRYFTILEHWKGASPWDMRPNIFQSPYEPEKPLQSELSQAQLLWRSTITWWRSLAEKPFEALGPSWDFIPAKTYTIIPSKIAVGNISALFNLSQHLTCLTKTSKNITKYEVKIQNHTGLCLAWCLKVDYHWDAKLQGRVLAMHQFLEIWHSLDLGWQIIGWCIYGLFPKQASACMCTV